MNVKKEYEDFFNEVYVSLSNDWKVDDEKIYVYETLRRMMFIFINDVTDHSKSCIENLKIKSLNDVRNSKIPLIDMRPKVRQQLHDCRVFLRKNLYQHPRVNKMTNNAQKVISDLFTYYVDHFDDLPKEYRALDEKYRSIADFLSGMTDRFANNIHKTLI